MGKQTLMIPEISVAYTEMGEPLWLVLIQTNQGDKKLDISIINGKTEAEVRGYCVEYGQVVYVERVWQLFDRARMMLTIDKRLGLH